MGSNNDDLLCADWDDTELIKAFEKSLKARDPNANQDKKNSKSSKQSSKWKVGDYCRAVYDEDMELYEAKITNIFRNKCTIDFLGYGNEQEVNIALLKESKGKSARKKQIELASKEVEEEESSGTDEESSYTEVESYSENDVSRRSKRKVAIDDSHLTHYTEESAPYQSRERNYPHSHPGHVYAQSAYPPTHWPEYGMPQAPCMPSAPGGPFPFAMPQCHETSPDTNFSSMLAAWYMAGYYTGLHQGEKKCRKCCCYN